MPRILSQSDIADFRSRTCGAAVELFNEVGFDGFTMRDLANRLGTSAMTPYRYFESKSEILALVKARGFAMLGDRLDAVVRDDSAAAKGVTAAFLRCYLNFAREESAYYKLMFDQSNVYIGHSSELDHEECRVRSLFAEYGRFLTGNDDDLDRVGNLVWSLLHGHALFRLADRVDDASDLLAEAILAAIGSARAGHTRTVPDVSRRPHNGHHLVATA